MRVPSIVGAVGAIALASLGCGPPAAVLVPPTAPSAPLPDEHLVLHSTAALADTIVVALFDGVDPAHAPDWRNQSERLVFHHLYESMNVGLQPYADTGLLTESRVSDNGRIGSFKLRDNARFWDGTRVTSRDVAETLQRARYFARGIDSVTTPDDRTIDVYVADRSFEWKALMSPTFAITRGSAGIWPVGTGPYRVVESDAHGHNLTIQPAFDSSRPTIQFVDARGIDARDVLDPAFRPRIDFTVIDDPNVVGYATSQNRFHQTQLGASKAYFLLSVTRVRALETGADLPTIPDSLTQAIARDAIRSASARSIDRSGETRWSDLDDCDPPSGNEPVGGVSTKRRVVYDAADPTARDIADRIVALAAGDPWTSTDVARLRAAVPGLNSSVPGLVAVGVSAGELASSLASSADFAYIVALPLGRPESCFLPRELVRMAPWLGAGRAPLSQKTIPLVATAPYAVASHSGSGAAFALNVNVVGNIFIVGTSRTDAP